MDWFSADFVKALSPMAVLLIFFLLNMLGYIRPKRAIDEARADRDKIVALITEDRDSWRTAYYKSEEARDKAMEISKEGLEIAKTNEAVINALRIALGQRGPDV